MSHHKVPEKGVWGKELESLLKWLDDNGINYESGKDKTLHLNLGRDFVQVNPGQTIIVTYFQQGIYIVDGNPYSKMEHLKSIHKLNTLKSKIDDSILDLSNYMGVPKNLLSDEDV